MSFWNFLCEFALFNMIRNWFSQTPKLPSEPVQPYHKHSRYADDISVHDTDALQDRIDRLECQLDDCDIMSDRYDRIQDEIDRLQDRLDEIEDSLDIYDDMDDDLDLYHDFDDDDW